jgi:eukaryotic-like serine/threonine-protein kinase
MSGLPHSIGPFRVLGLLGQGGMGVVYRGVHEATGLEAAIKTVLDVDRSGLEGLRREIQALSRMRHPGIVRVLDSGLHEGAPWYAMELLEGKTLRSEMRSLLAAADPVETRTMESSSAPETDVPGSGEAPHRSATLWWSLSLSSGPEPLPSAAPSSGPVASPERPPAAAGLLREALTLVVRLCQPLGFLHGEGIVHRDLKPENILLRAASGERRAASEQQQRAVLAARRSQLAALWPVLVDFGLASRWAVGSGGLLSGTAEGGSREAVDTSFQAAGTMAYMAPEQIRGELLDARADLYSLGCILYELLTGQRPFHETNEGLLARAHLQREPRPPSELVDGVEPALEELTLSLLAKDPRHRLGYADAVAAELQRLGAEPQTQAAGPPPRAYLYRPGFAGRAELLKTLLSWADEGRAHRGAIALVGGESGVGKTRLALELGRRLGSMGSLVLTGGPAPEAGKSEQQTAPLGMLRAPLRAIADRCRSGSPEEARQVLGGRIRLLAAYEPALLDLPDAGAEPEPAAVPAAAARLRLFHALTETFCALAGQGRTVILLDDLQDADELSTSWLEALLGSRRLESSPLLVVGTYRSGEVREDLRRLLGHPGVRRLDVGRIEPEAVETIVGDMLAMYPPPSSFAAFLTRQSEGNPFFVAEYLRTAVEVGLLGRDARGRWQLLDPKVETEGWEGIPLPGSLRELVLRHLSGLGPEARRLAGVASVLGREVDPAWLQALAGVPHEEVLAASQELLIRQVLEDPGTGPLRFAHDKLREIAYDALAARERRRLHRRAAETLEAAAHEPGREPWARLGHHWQRAGAPARARKHYLAAARQAVARYALGEAEQLYRSYLALLRKPTAESVTARNALGHDVLLRRGRSAEAQREHETAIAEARQLGDRTSEAIGLYQLAAVLARTGSTARAREICLESVKHLRSLAAPQALGEALTHLGSIELGLGELEAARSHLREALELNRRTGATNLQGTCIEALGVAAWKQGRLDEAWTLWQQALELQRRSGNRINEGTVLRNLAALASMQGRFGQSRELLLHALAIFREIGALREEAIALSNLGVTAWEMGHHEESNTYYQLALELQRSIGDRRSEGISLNNLAALRGEQGELEAARQLYRQGLVLLREAGDRNFEAMCLRDQATLERRLGTDLTVAETLLHESESIYRRLGNDLERARCQCEMGHVKLVHRDDARPSLVQARRLAGRLPGPLPQELMTALDRLEASIVAAEAGEPLHRGERLQDLPASLRRRLGIGVGPGPAT